MSTATEAATERVVHRSCPLCEATCGIDVRVDITANRALSVRGDEKDPLSAGYICPKAHGLIGLQDDPDRLRRPLRRDGSTWREIDWEEAFAFAASGLREIREAHGANALAAYVGNPNVHDMGSMIYLRVLLRALDTKKRFSASSVDQLPKQLSGALMFGGSLSIPIPDVDHTDFLLVLGANPVVSNGSLMTAPDMRGRLRRLAERGGKLVVVDPRRSETARLADRHLFIQPGTDALFLFSLIHVLFEEELTDTERLETLCNGLDEVHALSREFAPEITADVTGIDAADTRSVARDFAAARTAACYGRIGTCTQEFGTLTSWLVDVVNAITGNLDREGGALFPLTATSSAAPGPPPVTPLAHARWRSKSGLPETFGELPVASLAGEIDSGGDDRVHALLAVAGNPVLSTPNSARLAKAVESLDFFVAVDFYLNESTRFADIILPPTAPLERSHYDLVFNELAVRNVAKYSPPAVQHEPEARHQWQILCELAGRLHGANADVVDELAIDSLLGSCVGREETACPNVSKEDARTALGEERGPERLLDLMLRAGPYGDRFDDARDGLSLAKLKASPHGVDLGPLRPQLPDRLTTESRRIELAPQLLVDDVERLRSRLEERPGHPGLVLIGRRQVRTNNSWMHNIHALAKGRDRCTLLVHPDDARALRLEDGGRACVRSRVGKLVAPVVVSDEMMPGVVSLPHGFGHGTPGVRLSVASNLAPGVNINLLTDETFLDPVSGNAGLSGVPVEVEPA